MAFFGGGACLEVTNYSLAHTILVLTLMYNRVFNKLESYGVCLQHRPDFFIFTGPDGQGDAWIHDHTVWGVLADEESFATMDKIYELPTVRSGPATLLADDSGRQATVPFNMSLAA